MLPDINLLPDYERQNSFLFIVFWIGLIICLILFVVLGYFYFTEKSTLEDTEANIQQLQTEKEVLEQQLANLNKEDESETIVHAASFVQHHLIPTSAFIDELITLLPENGYLSNYNYSYQTVDIETQFETMQDAASYVAALLDSPFTKDVKINAMDSFYLEANQTETEETEETSEVNFDEIPRYDVSYSIVVDQPYMKEVGGINE